MLDQSQIIQSLSTLSQLIRTYDKVGEATALVSSLKEMLEVPFLDLKCVRLIQRLDILKMYLKKLPEVVNELYDKIRESIRLLLSNSMGASRTTKMEKVRDALKDHKVFRMCISDLKSEGVLRSSYKIGEGGFGQVYKGLIAGVPTVLKSVEIGSLAGMSPDSTTISLDRQPKEYKLGVALNDFVLTNQCPNFMLTYDIGACFSTRDAIYFIEEANFDLAQAFEQRFFGPISQVSLLAQLLIALHYVHTRLHVAHRDIKSQNILLIKTPSLARTLMSYEVDGRTFVLENTGVVPCLADFGISRDLDLYGYATDVNDLLDTFVSNHRGYPDLLPAYKDAFNEARKLKNPPLDTLQFILNRINYKPTEDLPISKVYKSILKIAPGAIFKRVRGLASNPDNRGFDKPAGGGFIQDNRGFDKPAGGGFIQDNRGFDKPAGGGFIQDNRGFDNRGFDKPAEGRRIEFISDNRGFDKPAGGRIPNVFPAGGRSESISDSTNFTEGRSESISDDRDRPAGGRSGFIWDNRGFDKPAGGRRSISDNRGFDKPAGGRRSISDNRGFDKPAGGRRSISDNRGFDKPAEFVDLPSLDLPLPSPLLTSTPIG